MGLCYEDCIQAGNTPAYCRDLCPVVKTAPIPNINTGKSCYRECRSSGKDVVSCNKICDGDFKTYFNVDVAHLSTTTIFGITMIIIVVIIFLAKRK